MNLTLQLGGPGTQEDAFHPLPSERPHTGVSLCSSSLQCLSRVAVECVRQPIAALEFAIRAACQVFIAVDALLFDDTLDQLRSVPRSLDSENSISRLKGAGAIGKPSPPHQTPMLDRC